MREVLNGLSRYIEYDLRQALFAHLTTLDGVPLRYDGEGVLNPPFVCTSLPAQTWAAAARAIG